MDRAERTGLGVAIVGHAALFVALSFSLLATEPLKPLEKPIDVILVEETAVESTAPEIAKAAAPPVPEPASVTAPAAPPLPEPVTIQRPKPVAIPEPEPAPRPEQKLVSKPKPALKSAPKPKSVSKPKLVEKPKPLPKAAPKPKPAPVKEKPKTTPKPTGRLNDLNVGSSGASTIPKPSGSQATKGSGASTSGAAPKGAPAQKTAAQIKQSIRASIYSEVRPKFRQLAPDGVDIEQLVTTLEVRVNPNGSLAGEPRLISQTGKTESNRPQQALHVERAIKAVKVAAPFAMSEKDFQGVQVIELEFKIQ